MFNFKDHQPKKPKFTREQKAEAERQRQIVKDTLWPIFLKAKNIKDAKNICRTLVMGLDTVFQMEMKRHQEERSKEFLATLKLQDVMNESDAYKLEWEVVNGLSNESIATARGLIDGMEKELSRLTDKELLERPVGSLKTEWL